MKLRTNEQYYVEVVDGKGELVSTRRPIIGKKGGITVKRTERRRA